MRQIRTTLFALLTIAVVIFMISEAQSVGAPWIFTAFAILVIIVIVISVIRAWLRL